MTRKEEIEKYAREVAANQIHCVEIDVTHACEWADRTMLDKVCDFTIANAYKYGRVIFVDNKATFDFRAFLFLCDLKRAMEE